MNHLKKILGGGFSRRAMPSRQSPPAFVPEAKATEIAEQSPDTSRLLIGLPAILPAALAPPFAAAACRSIVACHMEGSAAVAVARERTGDQSISSIERTCGCCIFWLDPYGNWACQACEAPARMSMVRRRAMVIVLRRLPDDPVFDLPVYECGWADPDDLQGEKGGHQASRNQERGNATSAAGSGREAAREPSTADLDQQRPDLEPYDDLSDWTEIPPEVERRWEMFDRGLGGKSPRPAANDYPFSPSWIAAADKRIADLKAKVAAERAAEKEAKAKNKKSGVRKT